jgi:hypothetical protein
VSQIIVPELQVSSNIDQQSLNTESGSQIDTESGEGIALEDPTFKTVDF